MKRLLHEVGLIVASVMVVLTSEAQTPELLWAKPIGGNSSDYGYATAVDGSGNSYVTGNFTGTADFDPGVGVFNLTSVGFSDIFVAKFDPAGNLVWAVNMGGTTGESSYAIAVDGSGNVYTTGSFFSTADFDPGVGTHNLISKGSRDIFVSKLDANGNFVWAKGMGSTSLDEGKGIVIDNGGNVLTTGYFYSSFFDPSGTFVFTSSGQSDVFVCKLDASGNMVWAKHMGGISYDQGNSIAIDAGDNVLTTGVFYGTADFDPGAATFNLISAGGSQDIFVSKLDNNGNFGWAAQFGGTSGDVGSSVAVDGSGNVIGTGAIYFDFAGDPIDFDPGAGVFNLTPLPGNNYGGADIYVVKLHSDGTFFWAQQLSGVSYEEGRSVNVDGSGNVYTTGDFIGTVDFDPGPSAFKLTANNNYDIFVSKLDAATGSFVWAQQFGGPSYDVGYGIAVDGAGNVLTTGSFQGSGNFGTGSCVYNVTVSGGSNDDVFLHKISQTPVPPPGITSFSPLNGPAGTVITLTGTNFDPVPANNFVYFNGLLTTVSASTSTSITTIVPVGAVDGPITVSIACKSASSTSFDVTGPCNIPLYERAALVDLYNSTNGAAWTNSTNWNTADESTWYGITVVGCRVTEIDLSFNQLNGTIPTTITNLGSLQVLKLFNNTLSGQLPYNIGNLTALKQLQTQNNSLSGLIPATLASCAALENLHLEGNQMGGPIPAFLGSLSNLFSINLGFNAFNGPIPPELGNLPLTFLSLTSNNLSSAIPMELGNLTSLQLLDLSRNQLTGSIPPELGNMSSLQSLQLWTNQLTGGYPTTVENLTNLQDLNLSDNQLTGSVTCNFSNMPNLSVLMLNHNQFDGSFPNSITSLAALQTVNLAQNQFTDIPKISSTNLSVENNKLDFADLELSIASVTNFTYSPQATLPPGGTTSFAVGGTLNIPFTTVGSANLYQWYNTGTLLTGATSSSLSKSGMTASDAGLYYVQITSSIVTGLTLESDPFIVFTDICSAVTPSTGDIDLPFDTHIDLPTSIIAIGLQSTGQILAYTGTTTSVNGSTTEIPSSGITRFNSDGTLDNTFNFIYGNMSQGFITVLPDDHFYAVINNGYYPDLQKFQPDGSYDNTFSANIENPTAVGLQPDGNIVVSYTPSSVQMARFFPDGSTDGSFSAPPNLYANVIRVQADGNILVGGIFPGNIVRLDNLGALDPGFTASADGEVTDVAIQPDGKIIVAGKFYYFNNVPHQGIVRLNTDGSLDNSFKAIGITDSDLTTFFPSKISLLTNGQIVLAGKFTNVNGTARANLVRLNVDGTVDCFFDPGTGTDTIVYGLALQADGKILASGDFTTYNGNTRNSLVRINNFASCIPPTQRAALIALYNSSNGANWTNKTNWLSADESTWFGVTTNACNVTNISLSTNNLVGTLPPDLGNLTALSYLVLDNNQLTGSIPIPLTTISTMQNLNLSFNQLTGTIPKELGSMPALSFLELESNQLTGSIPPELGNISTLAFLRLSDNQLTGSIPASFGNLNNVFLMEAKHNQLTGSIPTVLGQNTLLRFLDLGENQLSGTIPSELGNIPVLQELNLSYNLLTGSIPTSLGNLPNLTSLGLANNQLTGPIPSVLGLDTKLQSINLYSNQLSGSIPVELGNLPDLEVLWIFTNKLTGNIPIEIAQLSKLRVLGVADNLLTGNLPVELQALTNLEIFQINDNGFTGDMPVEYLAWTKVKALYLSRNKLTSIPTFPPALITNLAVEDNLLDFGDLEPNMGITGFTYSPQGNLPGGTISVDQGHALTIPFSTPGTANQYQWFKNGASISGATLSSFSIAAVVPADAGNYTIDITSAIVTGLTLHSLPFVVTIIANSSPVISTTPISVPVQGTTTISLLTLISDPDNNLDLASLSIAVPPSSGAIASLNGTDLVLDYSGINFSGTDFLTLSVCDLKGACTTQQISIEVAGDIIVYNGVSPNGMNPTLIIKYIDILPDTKNNTVYIFDRWENQVWKGVNYDNTSVVFSGVSDGGSALPSGVYFYKIQFGSGRKTITGFISLRRQ